MANVTENMALNDLTYVEGESINVSNGATLTWNEPANVLPGTLSFSENSRLLIERVENAIPLDVRTYNNAHFVFSELSTFEIKGGWYYFGTSNGTTNQSFPIFSLTGIDYPTLIEVETGNGTNVFEPWWVLPTVGAIFDQGALVSFADTQAGFLAGNVIEYNHDLQTITFGDGSNANIPPNGARLRVPNVHVSGEYASDRSQYSSSETNINCLSLGQLDFEICSLGFLWLQLAQGIGRLRFDHVGSLNHVNIGVSNYDVIFNNFSMQLCPQNLTGALIFSALNGVNNTFANLYLASRYNTIGINTGIFNNLCCYVIKPYTVADRNIVTDGDSHDVYIKDLWMLNSYWLATALKNSYIENFYYWSENGNQSNIFCSLTTQVVNCIFNRLRFFNNYLPNGEARLDLGSVSSIIHDVELDLNGNRLTFISFNSQMSETILANFNLTNLTAFSGSSAFSTAKNNRFRNLRFNNDIYTTPLCGGMEQLFADYKNILPNSPGVGGAFMGINRNGLDPTKGWLLLGNYYTPTTDNNNYISIEGIEGTDYRFNGSGLLYLLTTQAELIAQNKWPIKGVDSFDSALHIDIISNNQSQLDLEFQISNHKENAWSNYTPLNSFNLYTALRNLIDYDPQIGIDFRLKIKAIANNPNLYLHYVRCYCDLAAINISVGETQLTTIDSEENALSYAFLEDGSLVDRSYVQSDGTATVLFPYEYDNNTVTYFSRVRKAGYSSTDFTGQYHQEDFTLLSQQSRYENLPETDPNLTSEITITDHGATPIQWNAGDGLKEYSITIQTTAIGDSRLASEIVNEINYNLARNGNYFGYAGYRWHELAFPVGEFFETKRGILVGTDSNKLKGVRVIDSAGNPFPDFSRFQSDDGSYGTPPLTTTIRIVNLELTYLSLLDDQGVQDLYVSSYTGTYIYNLPSGASGIWQLTIDRQGYDREIINFIADGSTQTFDGALNQRLDLNGNPIYGGESNNNVTILDNLLIDVKDSTISVNVIYDMAQDFAMTATGMQNTSIDLVRFTPTPTGDYFSLGLYQFRRNLEAISMPTISGLVLQNNDDPVDESQGQVAIYYSGTITPQMRQDIRDAMALELSFEQEIEEESIDQKLEDILEIVEPLRRSVYYIDDSLEAAWVESADLSALIEEDQPLTAELKKCSNFLSQ